MRHAPARCVALVLLLAVVACRHDQPPPPVAAQPLPPALPVGLNEIEALALSGETLYVATSDGLVAFDTKTTRHRVITGDASVTFLDARDVAVAPDGTVWSAHALPEPGESGRPAAPRRGGLRQLRPDGSWSAFFAEDGLASDDVTAVAAGDGVVAAVAGGALVIRRTKPDGSPSAFARVDVEPRREILVVDASAGGASRIVTEFVPRDEQVTALAARGTRILAGTTHGLQLLEPDARKRLAIPCVREATPAGRVLAVALDDGAILASLATNEQEWRPAGLLQIDAALTHARCLLPGVDVPDAPAFDVATQGGLTWLATYEGLIRIRGDDVVLFERGQELPSRAVVAVAPDGASGCWVGTWGAGILHVRDGEVDGYRLDVLPTVAARRSWPDDTARTATQ
jgi:hypothetical protein